MMPLVSVIVASYNHAQYVSDSILSIVNQSYPHLEVIVIDDGSTDNSPAILSELSARYGLRVIRQDNSGIARTFNLGISLSKGEYICLTSSDDVWTKEKIGIEVTFMENNPDVAVCGGDANLMNEKSEITKVDWFRASGVLTFERIFVHGEQPPAFTAMIRRAVLADVGWYDPDFAVEDFYMWLKIAHKGYKIVLLDDVLGYYRVHHSNLHNNKELIIENVQRTLSRYKNEPSYNRAVNQYHLRLFCHFVYQGDRKMALRYLLKYRIGILNMGMFLKALTVFLAPTRTYLFVKGFLLGKKERS